MVAQARHDLYISQPITRWPTTRSLDHLLFEQECVQCESRNDATGEVTGRSCACGRGRNLNRQRQELHRIGVRGCSREVQTCSRDHLLWTPRRHLPLIARLAREGQGGHGLIEGARAALGSGEHGFLFPTGYCDEFQASLPPTTVRRWSAVLGDARYARSFMHLECIEELGYRPVRADPDSWAF